MNDIARPLLTVVLHAGLAVAASLCGATTVMPVVPKAEAVVIKEAYRMADELGEEIWPGFSAVPFPIVLVTDDLEFLVGWEGIQPEGFYGFTDAILGKVSFRDRIFSPGLSAAFPAFGPPSVVVIGTMKNTERLPGEWALTLLHEHFHQLQYAGEGYYGDVEELDLAGDDPSGMWMLEYPFPYEDESIGSHFGELAATLQRALEDDRGVVGASKPRAALRRLLDALEPADARYLSLQLWQEGVSRFVEARAAEVLAADFELSEDFLALDGFTGWRGEAVAQRERLEAGLESVSLAEQGRVSFYPVGAALAMQLERQDPGWKERYETPRFALERYGRTAAELEVEITYLANEGFLLAAGDDKVLVDALFPGIDGYPSVPPALRAKLDRAEAPFDSVDAVLATHFHGDHFGPEEVARHLASSGAIFVSTPDAVRQLKSVTEERFDVVAQHPAEGMRSRLSIGDDLAVTILNLHHGRSRRDIQNLGFVVEIGGLKVLHVGDTEVKVPDIEAYGLASAGIDVALLPGWLLAEPSWRPVVKEFGARHLVVMHLAAPDAPASWFGSAGSRDGRIALILRHFPDAWIPTEALATRVYQAAP